MVLRFAAPLAVIARSSALLFCAVAAQASRTSGKSFIGVGDMFLLRDKVVIDNLPGETGPMTRRVFANAAAGAAALAAAARPTQDDISLAAWSLNRSFFT